LLEAVDQSGGWLLDGYPRSLSQSMALDALDIRPQLFILLDVPDEILVQRSVGRRYDPVTGKIYHLMYAPPETPEIAARLTQRLDDTEEKVKLRLQTHKANVAAVVESYKDVIKHVSLSYQNLSFLACGYCSGGGFLQIVLFYLLQSCSYRQSTVLLCWAGGW
jgi:adenylate kinase